MGRWDSICRICKSWSGRNRHFVSHNPDSKSIVEYMIGHEEECIPSDNLEYLEWCLEKKLESR
jgi:hypothetical protein